MRTEPTNRASLSATSLTDFTRAVRDAREHAANSAGLSLTLAGDLQPAIPIALSAATEKTIDEALAGCHPVDPLLGREISIAVSTLNSAVKRSGTIIEKALAASLERAGFVVLTQVSMQLTAAARDLVANNSLETLRGVAIAKEAPDEGPTVIFDLLVWCPRNRKAWLLEVKRGNGPTEMRKTKPIVSTLQAGALQVKSYLARMGLKTRSVEARVVDYYGNSGFPDNVRITGDQLDRVFAAPIRPLIEAVLERLRARLFTSVPHLLMQAMTSARHECGHWQPRTVTLSGGVKVAPEHVPSIQLPARRKSKRKAGAKLIAIADIRKTDAAAPGRSF